MADTVNESNAQFSDKNLIICVLSVFSSYKNKTCYGLALISIFFLLFHVSSCIKWEDQEASTN